MIACWIPLLAHADPPVDDRDEMIESTLEEALGVNVSVVHVPTPECEQPEELDRWVCALGIHGSGAVEALVAMGPGAVGPVEAKVMTAEVSFVAEAGVSVLARLGKSGEQALLRILVNSRDSAALRAAVEAMAAKGAAAVDPLMRAIRRSEGRGRWLVRALVLCGPEAAPHLERLIVGHDDSVSHQVVLAAGDLGSDAAYLLPTLAARFDATGSNVERQSILDTLGRIGTGRELMVRATTHPNQSVRYSAASALSKCDPAEVGEAEEAALLRMVQHDPYGLARSVAASALGTLGRGDPKVLAALRANLDSADSWVTTGAAGALATLSSAPEKEAVGALMRIVSDPADRRRAWAAHLLGTFGPRADDAVPVLKDALASGDYELEGNAATALQHLGDPGWEVLRSALGSPITGKTVARSLLKAPPDEPRVLPLVREALAADDRDVVYWAVVAAGDLKIADDAVVRAVIGHLGHDSGSVRVDALRTLREIGAPAIDALRRVARSKHADASFAAEALTAMERGGP